MNKLILFTILFSLFSCKMKNGNFSCKCEKIKTINGIDKVSFQFGKSYYEGDTAELRVYFKVDTAIQNCLNYTFYFQGLNDTLKVNRKLNNVTSFTSNKLEQHLESSENLKLRIFNSCNQTINVFDVDCHEIKEKTRIRVH